MILVSDIWVAGNRVDSFRLDIARSIWQRRFFL